MEPLTFKKQLKDEIMKKLNSERHSSGTYCDVTLIVRSSEFFAHKCVLNAASEYFDGLIKNVEMVYIDGVDEETMSIILDFIYCCDIKLTKQNVYKVLEASEFMEIRLLRDHCLEYLNKLLDVGNCFTIRSYARKHNYSYLAKVADVIIKNQPDSILRYSSFKHLCFDDVEEVIKIKHKQNDDPYHIIGTPEKYVFFALVRWVKQDLIHRMQHFEELFWKIKLGALSVTFLKSVVLKEDLIKEFPERFMIAQSILSDRIAEKRLKRLSRIINKTVYFDKGFLVVNGIQSFVYDVTAKLLFKMPDLKINCYGGSIINFNDEIYVIGGCAVRSVGRLNLKNVSSGWVDLTSTNENRWNSPSAVCGEYIYTVGGESFITSSLSSSAAERYDISSNNWSKIENMKTKREGHCLTSFEGKLFVFGGLGEDGPLDSVECFDPLTNRWEMLPSMKSKRNGAAAVVLEEAIYVIGGHDGDGELSSMERYHSHNETWEEVAPLKQARYGHGACVVNGKIYVAGGWHKFLEYPDTIEVYDATENIWEIESIFNELKGRINITPASILNDFEINI